PGELSSRSAMKRAICIGIAVAVVTSGLFAQVRPASQPVSRAPGGTASAELVQARTTLDTYCVTCHNSRVRAGGVAFDTVSLDAVHEHADVLEKALRKLRGRLMPPPGNRQPEQREVAALVSWRKAAVDAPARVAAEASASAARRTAGHVPIQRLTRTEFGTAVND